MCHIEKICVLYCHGQIQNCTFYNGYLLYVQLYNVHITFTLPCIVHVYPQQEKRGIQHVCLVLMLPRGGNYGRRILKEPKKYMRIPVQFTVVHMSPMQGRTFEEFKKWIETGWIFLYTNFFFLFFLKYLNTHAIVLLNSDISSKDLITSWSEAIKNNFFAFFFWCRILARAAENYLTVTTHAQSAEWLKHYCKCS